MAAEPYLGAISIFGFTYAPRNYAFCNGQTYSVSQNTALFALLGTQYGGDGQTTFAVPNLKGRVPMHYGQLAGGSSYVQGQMAGSESVTLNQTQLPMHTHGFVDGGSSLNAVATKATDAGPAAGSMLARATDKNSTDVPLVYVPTGTPGNTVALGGVNVAGTITPTGGSAGVPILQPYLTLNFCIAISGVFPSRN